jgi:hypothetical protein
MKRLLLALALCALVVSTVSAATTGGSMTWRAKHITPNGNTHPLEGGYVMWATHNMFGGLSPWRYSWLDANGAATIRLPLPVICWSGTEACFTLDGQWLYWTVIPPNMGQCTPASGQAARGVTWIAQQTESMGTVWQGECQP